MSIYRQIITQMDGEMSMEASNPTGLKFSITIPIQAVD